MSESDTYSYSEWPVDSSIEEPDRLIIFKDVEEQYVKGEDLVVTFNISSEVNVNENEDQLGLMRIGTINFKDCVAYAKIHLEPSSSASMLEGTATFPASVLPTDKYGFYQFCYPLNKTKILDSSTSFQFNRQSNENTLTTSGIEGKTRMERSVVIDDHDDDIVLIDDEDESVEGKLRKEKRELADSNRQLETQIDEYHIKLEVFENEFKEEIGKLTKDMQAVIASRQLVVDELSACQETEAKVRAEYEKCRAQCQEYQDVITEQTNRCREVEETHSKIVNQTEHIRSQLSVAGKLTTEQVTQITELEKRLLQANEWNKTAEQRHSLLEKQIRDLRFTSEKQQANMQNQIENITRLNEQHKDQIVALQETNHLCREELKTLADAKEDVAKLTAENKALAERFQQDLETCRETYKKENRLMQEELNKVQTQLNDQENDQGAYKALKKAVTEVEKRCGQHQRNESEAKRQLVVYENTIKDLKHQVQEVKQRLNNGATEYQTLYRKYLTLERSMAKNSNQIKEEIPEVPQPTRTVPNEPEVNEEEEEQALDAVLRNTAEVKDNTEPVPLPSLDRSSFANIDGEVLSCPVCSWEFPRNLNDNGKREHVESHFEQ